VASASASPSDAHRQEPAGVPFDEPLSNLDAKLRVSMRTELKAIHQRLKTTSIYVTHDQIEAMTMADRIVVMNLGKIEQIGTPLDLYDNPSNLFVAGFIGSPAMNLLRGTVRRSDLGMVVNLAPGLDLPTRNAAAREGQEVIVGVRPEHFTVRSGGPGRRGDRGGADRRRHPDLLHRGWHRGDGGLSRTSRPRAGADDRALSGVDPPPRSGERCPIARLSWPTASSANDSNRTDRWNHEPTESS
jgi:hypothetical protein